MRLSFSSIETYENCGRKWYYQYRESRPTLPSPSLSFGSSVHAALEAFYGQPVPVAPPVAALLGMLDAAWISEGYADPDEEARYRSQAEDVLRRFHADNAPIFRLPAAIEQRFEIDVDGITVNGQIDRLDRHADGSYEVIDYKTNRKLPPRSTIDANLQLSIYHLAAREVWGVEPARLTLYFLLPGQPMSTSRTPRQLDQTRRRIQTVAERIDAEMFEPRPNPLCGWCSFRGICPAFRHEREVAGGTSDPEMADLLDEWLELTRASRERDARLATVEARILEFAERGGYARLWSRSGEGVEPQVTSVPIPADERALRGQLEPLGLWDDAVRIDPERLARLARSGRLPAGLERRILVAERGTTRWSLRHLPPAKGPGVGTGSPLPASEVEGSDQVGG